MSNGIVVYVTLPGWSRLPVNVPNDATLPDFCREVHKMTGVSLFNGFGFKTTYGSTFSSSYSYVVPTAAKIVNVKPDEYDNTSTASTPTTVGTPGALTSAATDISASVIDSDAGTVATLATMGITHGMHLIFFSLAQSTTAAQVQAQLDANT